MKAIFILLLFYIAFDGWAQKDKPKDLLVGLHFFYNDFKTAELIKSSSVTNVLKQKTWSKPLAMQSGFGLNVIKNINHKVNLYATSNFSWIDYPNANYQYSGKDKFFLDVALGTQVSMFPKKAFFNPYLTAGISMNSWGGRMGYLLPVGAGLQVNIFNESYIHANFQKQLALTKNATHHFYYSIGIATTLLAKTKHITKHPKDTINLPKALAIVDKDTDGDGVIDKLDRCPDIVGKFANEGCPSTDKDNDGVMDEIDNCPDSAGPIANNGCPPRVDIPIVTESKEKMPSSNIRFAINTYQLNAISTAALDALANYLLNNKTVVILIEGHTDNIGSSASNILLSNKRAQSVKEYLIQKGISPNRLFVVGWGEEKPLTTNTTSEGRAINRRVEIAEK